MRERPQRQRHRANAVASRRTADVALQPRAQFAIPFDREQPPYLRDRLELLRQLGFKFGGKIRRNPSIPAITLGGKQFLDGEFLFARHQGRSASLQLSGPWAPSSLMRSLAPERR